MTDLTPHSARFDGFTLAVDSHGVAVLTIDVPGEKMNTLSSKVGAELRRAVEVVDGDPAIEALVIASGKPDNFIAGADIRELGGVDTAAAASALAKTAQEGFARLEAMGKKKPVVAAIHGPCLGGGYELALACTRRVASDADVTQVGLPEVQLGLLPGAGGTQRLPRLIGIAAALDIILQGKSVRARKAVKLGMVDEVVPAPVLVQVARRRARELVAGELGAPKRGVARLRELAQDLADPEFLQQVALEENPVGQRVLFRKARERLLEKTRGHYPAPEAALEAVRTGVLEGEAAGYAAELDRFGKLVVSAEAKALISIFFAQQELKKDRGVAGEVKPVELRKVGVLGGGLMGGGIAYVTAAKQRLPVRLNEVDDAGIARGLRYVRKALDKDVERKRLPRFEADRVMSRVTGTWEYAGFANCDVVIEAVFEDLALKHKVLREVEAKIPERCIFASNTSSLPIGDIAKASARPAQVIGMHYFSPVEKMPLLEIITTEHTADWVTATCVAMGKAQGKTVIVVRDGPGFYTSRILSPYINEAAWLLTEGAAIEDVDEALMDFGFPVGPVTLLDEVGIDVGVKVAGIMMKALGKRMSAPEGFDAVLKDGRLGRKNGRGFYRYEGGKKGSVDTSVYALLGARGRFRIPKDELRERVALQMINEAAYCLQDGILRSARDGDIGAVFGLGFPPFLGGPFAWIDRVGPAHVVARLEHYAAAHGERFTPAPILREKAKSGGRFR